MSYGASQICINKLRIQGTNNTLPCIVKGSNIQKELDTNCRIDLEDSSIDNQVPSTDGPKAEVPDSNPDSRRTPDDFDKNVPKDAAAPRNDFDAAVSKDVSDTVSKRTPDDSNGGSGR